MIYTRLNQKYRGVYLLLSILKNSLSKYKKNYSEYLSLSLLISLVVIAFGAVILCFEFSFELKISTGLMIFLMCIIFLFFFYPLLNFIMLYCHYLFFINDKEKNRFSFFKFLKKNYTRCFFKPNRGSLKFLWTLIKTIVIFIIFESLITSLVLYILVSFNPELTTIINGYANAISSGDISLILQYETQLTPYLNTISLVLGTFIIFYFVHTIVRNYLHYTLKISLGSFYISNKATYSLFKSGKNQARGEYFKLYFLNNFPIMITFYLLFIISEIVFSLFSNSVVFILVISFIISSFFSSFLIPMFINNIIKIHENLASFYANVLYKEFNQINITNFKIDNQVINLDQSKIRQGYEQLKELLSNKRFYDHQNNINIPNSDETNDNDDG